MKIVLFCSIFAASIVSYANAGVVITFSESGGNVNAVLSGSFDLNATGGLVGQTGLINFLNPGRGNVAFGGGSQTDYYDVDIGAPDWTAFGTLGGWRFDIMSGDNIALYSDPYLGLPIGYTSGAPLNGRGTIVGATFAFLGMYEGTYVTVVTNGNFTDTVTVNVIPEPASGALLVVGITSVAFWHRRRRA